MEPQVRFLPTQAVAPETFLIRQLATVPGEPSVPQNSLVIRGTEPIVVDTGGPRTTGGWLDRLFELVDPADVRWVFVSHEDPDHSGGLAELVARCPQATVMATKFGHERLERVAAIAPERVHIAEPGDVVQAGDRRLAVTRPPIFDSPTTVALLDQCTGVYWGADAFAVVMPDEYDDAADMAPATFDANFVWSQRLLSPWLGWVDGVRYQAHLDGVRALGVQVAVGAHGLALHDDQIDHAFDLFAALAGRP